jgi:hypothetical protein
MMPMVAVAHFALVVLRVAARKRMKLKFKKLICLATR